jgi:hypothetical protein
MRPEQKANMGWKVVVESGSPPRIRRLTRLFSRPGGLAKSEIYQKNCQSSDFRVIIQGFADCSGAREGKGPRGGDAQRVL